MLIKDLLQQKSLSIHSIHPNRSIVEAANKMKQNQIGFLLVMDQNRPVGLLSERDIVYKSTTSLKSPEIMTVADIMTSKMIWAKESTELKLAFEIMKKHGFRHLPIKSEQDEPLAIISERDITNFLYSKISPK